MTLAGSSLGLAAQARRGTPWRAQPGRDGRSACGRYSPRRDAVDRSESRTNAAADFFLVVKRSARQREVKEFRLREIKTTVTDPSFHLLKPVQRLGGVEH
jgi:hypothetical protein